ncbi:MAG TPA: DUF411 domain-containing protein [Sphingomicrobium sp.]|nr:DUF411 domain-containing protein [Sphingomicrobium sp.]
MRNWSRRDAIGVGAAAVGALALSGVARAAAKPAMKTYRDPGCGCCHKWVDHATAAGYPVSVVATREMQKVKATLQVPDDLMSCHTTTVAGYVVEGHVPLAAVDKLISTKPAGVIGIAVPGMPAGSPGMEAHGGHAGHAPSFKVYAFKKDGAKSEFRF